MAVEYWALQRSLATVIDRVEKDGRLNAHMFWSHDSECLRQLCEAGSEVSILTRRDDHASLTEA